jgi:hypothetical protein
MASASGDEVKLRHQLSAHAPKGWPSGAAGSSSLLPKLTYCVGLDPRFGTEIGRLALGQHLTVTQATAGIFRRKLVRPGGQCDLAAAAHAGFSVADPVLALKRLTDYLHFHQSKRLIDVYDRLSRLIDVYDRLSSPRCQPGSNGHDHNSAVNTHSSGAFVAMDITMTPAQYRDAIAKLGLSQERSGVSLGLSPRQGQPSFRSV